MLSQVCVRTHTHAHNKTYSEKYILLKLILKKYTGGGEIGHQSDWQKFIPTFLYA